MTTHNAGVTTESTKLFAVSVTSSRRKIIDDLYLICINMKPEKISKFYEMDFLAALKGSAIKVEQLLILQLTFNSKVNLGCGQEPISRHLLYPGHIK